MFLDHMVVSCVVIVSFCFCIQYMLAWRPLEFGGPVQVYIFYMQKAPQLSNPLKHTYTHMLSLSHMLRRSKDEAIASARHLAHMHSFLWNPYGHLKSADRGKLFLVVLIILSGGCNVLAAHASRFQ